MIDNEEEVTRLFTENLSLKSLPEMDRNLATQLMESSLLLTTIDNKDGTVTALRATCQQEAFNIRLDNCIKLANLLWDAARRPGAYSANASEWLVNFKNEIVNAVSTIYSSQLDEIEVKKEDLKVIGNNIDTSVFFLFNTMTTSITLKYFIFQPQNSSWQKWNTSIVF